jgi:hypothetical protein
MVLNRQANGNYTVVSKGKVHTKLQSPEPIQNTVPVQGMSPVQNMAPVQNFNVQSRANGEDYSVGAFVKTNVGYYETQFDNFASSDKKVCFNLGILLFAPFWLIYRRLYLHFFIYMLITAFTSFFWAANIVYSLFGVKIYYDRYKKLSGSGDYAKFKAKSGANALVAYGLAVSFAIIFAIVACSGAL